jgi:hypothetical protein
MNATTKDNEGISRSEHNVIEDESKIEVGSEI